MWGFCRAISGTLTLLYHHRIYGEHMNRIRTEWNYNEINRIKNKLLISISSLTGPNWEVIYCDLGFTEICLCIAATEVNGWETSQVLSRAWKSVVKLLASVCWSYSGYIRSPPPPFIFAQKISQNTHRHTHTRHQRGMAAVQRGAPVSLRFKELFACLLSFWCSLPSSSGAEMLNVQLWYEFVPHSPHCPSALQPH